MIEMFRRPDAGKCEERCPTQRVHRPVIPRSASLERTVRMDGTIDRHLRVIGSHSPHDRRQLLFRNLITVRQYHAFAFANLA